MNADAAPLAARSQRLVLGTVQFGVAYGIAGRDTPVPEEEVLSILDHAVEAGVRTLDTAAAYGDIEERLGRLIGARPLSVVSKVPTLPAELSPAEAAAASFAHAGRSLERLGDRLTDLLFHSASDLDGPRGRAIIDVLEHWADRHGVRLGVSGYQPDDALRASATYGSRLRTTQLPGNALDQRVDSAQARADLSGLDVHLRSAFLQGLLLMPEQDAVVRLPGAKGELAAWHRFCEARALAPLQAALGVVKSFSAVSAVVLGVDSLQQWRDITSTWYGCTPLRAPELACAPDAALIDPRQWKRLQ